MLRFIYDYIDVTKFENYMFNFLLRCLMKNFSHFSSIDVIPYILRRYRIVCAACGTVWNRFSGVSVQQVALWWVCVGIVWLLVKEIKWLLF